MHVNAWHNQKKLIVLVYRNRHKLMIKTIWKVFMAYQEHRCCESLYFLASCRMLAEAEPGGLLAARCLAKMCVSVDTYIHLQEFWKACTAYSACHLRQCPKDNGNRTPSAWNLRPIFSGMPELAVLSLLDISWIY